MRAQNNHRATSLDQHAENILIQQDATEDDDTVAIADYEVAKNTKEESFRRGWLRS